MTKDKKKELIRKFERDYVKKHHNGANLHIIYDEVLDKMSDEEKLNMKIK